MVEGEWSRVPSPGNPGQDDWRAAFARKRIHGLLRVRPFDCLKSPQQKCWGHLLWELRDCATTELSEEYRRAHRGLRRIFLDARRLTRQREMLPPLHAERRQRHLEARLFAWGATPYRNTTLHRLAGRILTHHHQLLTCLQVPDVSMDNHQAERAIRLHVIIRHRSYQSRSPTGAATHAALMSLVQTLALQGRAIRETLRTARAPSSR